MAVATAAAIIGAGAAVAGVLSDRKSASDAIKSQEDQKARNEAFIREQAAAAREDILPLFGAAQEARELGAQGALDIFGQTIPQQAQLFQGGNVAAQQALLGGLPQQISAIRGTPFDLSGLQPTQLDFDPSFAQQQLPQFQTTEQALAPPPAPINPVTGQPFDFSNFRLDRFNARRF